VCILVFSIFFSFFLVFKKRKTGYEIEPYKDDGFSDDFGDDYGEGCGDDYGDDYGEGCGGNDRKEEKLGPFVVRFVISRYKEDVQWTCNFGHTLRKEDISYEIWTYYKACVENKKTIENFRKDLFDIDCGEEDKVNNIKRKLICLPNVGRCDHTYLFYIVNEYDRLPDLTIFLPGSGMDEPKKERVRYTIKKALRTRDTVIPGPPASFNDFQHFFLDEWKATNEKNRTSNPEIYLLPAYPRPFGAWFQHYIGLHRPIRNISFNGIFAVHKRHILQNPRSFYENILSTVDHHSNPEAGHYIERSWSAIFSPLPDSCIG
jgi:hypothetical protein